MRRFPNPYRLLALTGLLSVVAWGCTTDSPTAPRQEPPPPPTQGPTYTISLGADPRGIAITTPEGTGTERTTLIVDVSNPTPPDGTLIELSTSLGSLVDPTLGIVRQIGAQLVGGRAFFTLFAGETPVQLGIATVFATLGGSRGAVEVPIAFLTADFDCTNPDVNRSVDFFNTSSPEAETFLWDFGDGTTSTERNPEHIFPTEGVFGVKLTVTRNILEVALETSTSKLVDTAVASCPA